MSLILRPARLEDADLIQLRVEDQEELGLYRSGSFRRTLGSPGGHWTAECNGHVVAIGGVAASSQGLHPWLMASPAIVEHRRPLAAAARTLVARLRAQPLPVWNLIGKASGRNRRFVEALGFVIIPLPEGPFDRFELPPWTPSPGS